MPYIAIQLILHTCHPLLFPRKVSNRKRDAVKKAIHQRWAHKRSEAQEIQQEGGTEGGIEGGTEAVERGIAGGILIITT